MATMSSTSSLEASPPSSPPPPPPPQGLPSDTGLAVDGPPAFPAMVADGHGGGDATVADRVPVMASAPEAPLQKAASKVFVATSHSTPLAAGSMAKAGPPAGGAADSHTKFVAFSLDSDHQVSVRATPFQASPPEAFGPTRGPTQDSAPADLRPQQQHQQQHQRQGASTWESSFMSVDDSPDLLQQQQQQHQHEAICPEDRANSDRGLCDLARLALSMVEQPFIFRVAHLRRDKQPQGSQGRTAGRSPRAGHRPSVREADFSQQTRQLTFRIGMHRGEVVCGVIPGRFHIFDVWGDTVNTASRMESYSLPGRVHCTEAVRRGLIDTPAECGGGEWTFEPRGKISIKGKGDMKTYFLASFRPMSHSSPGSDHSSTLVLSADEDEG